MRRLPDALPDDDEDEAQPTRVRDGRDRELGRYRLCFELASGGMGTVYLARDGSSGGAPRVVAIKRIHPHLARNRRVATMFLDEARIASRIVHPNVCRVFDYGEVRGASYLAMEYLLGEPVSALVRAVRRDSGRLESDRWIDLACAVAAGALEGLHAAHELRDEQGRPLGVVHRDVSPQNLFVTFEGATKVVDFGIAFAHDREHRTRTGSGIKGKLAYVAPEQAAGAPADRRIDVWAAGVCLWELLAGGRLFRRATDVETLKAIEAAPVPPPSELNPRVSRELDAVVLRALDRDPARRWPSARAMAEALGALPGSAPPAEVVSTTAAWMGELFVEERQRKLLLVQEALGAPLAVVAGLHAQETVRLPALGEDGAAAGASGTAAPRADPAEPGPDDAPAPAAATSGAAGEAAATTERTALPAAEAETAPVIHAQPTVRLPALAADETAPLEAVQDSRAAERAKLAADLEIDATIPIGTLPDELARAVARDLRRVRAERKRLALPTAIAVVLGLVLLVLGYVALTRRASRASPPAEPAGTSPAAPGGSGAPAGAPAAPR